MTHRSHRPTPRRRPPSRRSRPPAAAPARVQAVDAPTGRARSATSVARIVMWARLPPRDGPAGLDPLDRRHQGRPAARSTSTWWTNSQRGITARRRRRRRRPRHPGHAHPGPASPRVIAVPIGVLTAIYLVEYGRGAARPGGQLHGRHPHRRALDRRGAVHLRGVGDDLRLPAGRLRRLPRAGAADDPGRRALHRGDAQARARTSCARRPTPSACPSGRRSSRSCCRPRSPASSPACCSAWPGSWARPRRC